MTHQETDLGTTDRLAYGYADAGSVLGVSTSTVKRLVAAGDLRSVSVGKRKLLTRAELERFLAER